MPTSSSVPLWMRSWRHPIFKQYSFTPKGLLLYYLAEKIKAREPAKHSDLVETYVNLAVAKMPEAKIDKAALQEKADVFFHRLRESMMTAFDGLEAEVIDCIHESVGEVEETVAAMFARGDLIKSFQEKNFCSLDVLDFVPTKTLVRLIDKFPGIVFDGKVFTTMYSGIALADPQSTDRIRSEAKDRMVSFLKDAVRLSSAASNMDKNELSRIQISLDFLMEALV